MNACSLAANLVASGWCAWPPTRTSTTTPCAASCAVTRRWTSSASRTQASPGRRTLASGVIVEEVLLLAELSLEGEWEGQVRYLPLR